MKRIALILAAAGALAACTTPTVYAPQTSASGSGFSESPLEANRWRVTFRGGDDADPQRTYGLALRRAAELTLSQRNDWFEVVDRRNDVTPGNQPTFSVGLGGGSFGRGGGFGSSLGTSFGGPGLRSAVTLEVIMGRGPKPSPTAYDARQLLSSMSGAPV